MPGAAALQRMPTNDDHLLRVTSLSLVRRRRRGRLGLSGLSLGHLDERASPRWPQVGT